MSAKRKVNLKETQPKSIDKARHSPHQDGQHGEREDLRPDRCHMQQTAELQPGPEEHVRLPPGPAEPGAEHIIQHQRSGDQLGQYCQGNILFR